jgi:hypothetical protein
MSLFEYFFRCVLPWQLPKDVPDGLNVFVVPFPALEVANSIRDVEESSGTDSSRITSAAMKDSNISPLKVFLTQQS